MLHRRAGGGVCPSVTIGFFSYLSQSGFWPKVLHGGRGGVKNCQIWRNNLWMAPMVCLIVYQLSIWYLWLFTNCQYGTSDCLLTVNMVRLIVYKLHMVCRTVYKLSIWYVWLFTNCQYGMSDCLQYGMSDCLQTVCLIVYKLSIWYVWLFTNCQYAGHSRLMGNGD